MPVKFRETNFPDPLNQAAQKNITLAVDELSKRADIFASPVQFLPGSGAIDVDSSVAMWTGSAGGTISLPRSTAQGKNTAAVIVVGNLTINAVSVKAVAGETINWSTAAVTVAANASAILSSDGAGHWLTSNGRASNGTDIQSFTASGTWVVPANARMVFIYALGAGAGGGGGRRGAAGTVRGGGGGGGAGKAFQLYVDIQFLGTITGGVAAVTVGAGGTAGAAATVDNTDGGAGGNGGNTVLTTSAVFTAQGGTGGGGGTAGAGGAGGAGGAAASATTGVSPGAAGGAGGVGAGATAGGPSIVTAVTNNSLTPIHSPAGGGGGGGISAANATEAGAAGGASFLDPGGTAAANAAGGAGTSRATPSVNVVGTGGGGGSSGTVKTGGDGGSYGAGAGGGGASVNGTNSGAGGVGPGGAMIIITTRG